MRLTTVAISFLLQKTRFHVSQTLAYKNGYSLPLRPQRGVGGDPLPVKQVSGRGGSSLTIQPHLLLQPFSFLV